MRNIGLRVSTIRDESPFSLIDLRKPLFFLVLDESLRIAGDYRLLRSVWYLGEMPISTTDEAAPTYLLT